MTTNSLLKMKSFSELFARDFAKRDNAIKRQLLYSPTGWGRCVFPLHATNDKEAYGLGSGFFIKGLYVGITAEHLLDVGNLDVPLPNSDSPTDLDLSTLPYGLTALLPSQIVYFGTCCIPPEYSQPVRRFLFDIVKKDAPLLEFTGRQKFARKSDVLFLEFSEDAAIPPDDWRPTISSRIPQKGDWVCAVGFHSIQLHRLEKGKRTVLIENEGIAISFARVTQVEPSGRGQYKTSPVVFVDSDWPGGMSGGPVFADNGQVIGVVSRELVDTNMPINQGSFTLLYPLFMRTSLIE